MSNSLLDSSSHSNNNVGVIVGAVIGSVFGAGLLLLVAILLARKYRTKKPVFVEELVSNKSTT